MKANILVVDNEVDICKMIEIQLKNEGFNVRTAYSGQEAIEKAREQKPDLIITDMQMPGLSGLETMKKIGEIYPNQLFIVLTAHGSVESAVDTMKYGAYDYIQKPFNAPRLITTINHALETMDLKHKVDNLKSIVDNEIPLKKIIGSSSALEQIMKSVRKTFNLDTTVLILGESGTGKDLIANTIHENSTDRNQDRFVAVNCAALPETILESELFGHEKGAFTGASDRKIGKFEYAKGGTLFLDEVCEMSALTQAKLLRVLQEKEIQRLGSNEIISVDIRVIAATNKNIEEYVEQGLFREDLYYRLNVFTVNMPPLRQRKEDIEELSNHFIKRFNSRLKKNPPVKRVHQSALAILQKYHWPGNIRELQNVIERSMIESESDLIRFEDLPYTFTQKVKPLDASRPLNDPHDLPSTIEEMERKLIISALQKYNYNASDVAKALKIGRTTLYRKAEAYEISLKKGEE